MHLLTRQTVQTISIFTISMLQASISYLRFQAHALKLHVFILVASTSELWFILKKTWYPFRNFHISIPPSCFYFLAPFRNFIFHSWSFYIFWLRLKNFETHSETWKFHSWSFWLLVSNFQHTVSLLAAGWGMKERSMTQWKSYNIRITIKHWKCQQQQIFQLIMCN